MLTGEPRTACASDDTPLRPVGRLAALRDDELVDNGAVRVHPRPRPAFPCLVPRVNNLAVDLVSSRRYIDHSHRVFVSPRRVRFAEMEYAVPVETLPKVLGDARNAIDAHDWHLSFPVGGGWPPPTTWLSTAQGRRSAYLAAHCVKGQDHTAYFDVVERICRDVGGRPHWGKMHGDPAPGLRAGCILCVTEVKTGRPATDRHAAPPRPETGQGAEP